MLLTLVVTGTTGATASSNFCSTGSNSGTTGTTANNSFGSAGSNSGSTATTTATTTGTSTKSTDVYMYGVGFLAIIVVGLCVFFYTFKGKEKPQQAKDKQQKKKNSPNF